MAWFGVSLSSHMCAYMTLMFTTPTPVRCSYQVWARQKLIWHVDIIFILVEDSIMATKKSCEELGLCNMEECNLLFLVLSLFALLSLCLVFDFIWHSPLLAWHLMAVASDELCLVLRAYLALSPPIQQFCCVDTVSCGLIDAEAWLLSLQMFHVQGKQLRCTSALC